MSAEVAHMSRDLRSTSLLGKRSEHQEIIEIIRKIVGSHSGSFPRVRDTVMIYGIGRQ